MGKRLIIIGMCVAFAACGSLRRTQTVQPLPPPMGPIAVYIDENSSIVDEVSSDRTYGYSQTNPILVGGASISGPQNQRAFLDALAGPGGQEIEYERTGSCCYFKTGYAATGTGLLDTYEITYDGIAKPIVLYLNMYDPGGKLRIPYGFTLRKTEEPEQAIDSDESVTPEDEPAVAAESEDTHVQTEEDGHNHDHE